MTAENEARGRSSRDRKPGRARGAGTSGNQKGGRWRRRCVLALRTVGFPGADITPAGISGAGDIQGVGDINVECKDEATWAHLSDSIEQSERDAKYRGLPTSVVWRKRWGWPDPLDGWCVQSARQFWADRKEMERLEAVELEFASWRAGLAAAAQAREAG